MPTKLPRLNVVLDAETDKYLGKLAKKEGVSKSRKARDLLREALELYEDRYWSRAAEERESTFDPKKALSLEEVRARLNLPARKSRK
jgi:hypothetical protein